jgi:hypothetical protein
MDTEASSSIAVNRFTITCFFANWDAPTAIVMDITVGNAIYQSLEGNLITGIAAIVKTITFSKASMALLFLA